MREYFEKYDWTGLTLLEAYCSVSVTGIRVSRFAEDDKYQLGMKLGGKTDIVYDGKSYKYYGGTLIYLPKAVRGDVRYDRVVTEGGPGAYIFFDSMKELPPYPILIKLSDKERIYSLFGKLANIWSSRDARGFDSMAAFYKLLAAISVDSALSNHSVRATEKLADAENYLSEHFCDNYVDVRVLAELAGMSPDYFRHRFAAVYGVPPLQYIMRMKLDRAKELLSSGKSVNETAAAIGFTDPNYFTRFFKERTGVTPTEFVRRRLC